MIERLKQKMSEMTPNFTFDPSKFNDEIAMNTMWTSTSRSSSSFKSHNLDNDDPNRYEFKPTFFSKIFAGIFLVLGLSMVIWFLQGSGILSGEGVDSDLYMLLVVGSIFAVVGGFMVISSGKPIVFDKSNGYFWAGRKGPETVHNVAELKHAAKLEDIHALQILRRWKQSSGKNSSSYYVYELNLVLKDASRLNVLAHGNGYALIQDTQELAKFLEVPVWNATPVHSS